MKEIFSAVFRDFGTAFLDNERPEAISLLKNYLSYHFGLCEEAIDAYISTILSIADAVEWRKREFNE